LDDIKKIIKESGSPENVVDALGKAKGTNNLTDENFVGLVFEALVPSDSADVIAAIKASQPIFSKIIDSVGIQHLVLDHIERLCGITNKALGSKVSFIVKEFYDLDLLEEEQILHWYEKKSNSAVSSIRDQLAPLVKWLKEAEEESSGAEDDDEE